MHPQLIFIGDVHGKIDEYLKIVNEKYKGHQTIQLGDMGFAESHERLLGAALDGKYDTDFHKFLPGNHDDPYYFSAPHCLGNYGYNQEWDYFFIRGAKSIDRHVRTHGIDWWPEEQLSYTDLRDAIKLCEDINPGIIVTHDCPASIARKLFGYTEPKPSRTSMALDALFKKCQPPLWIFGHHHQTKMEVINTTSFVCLDELETFSIK
jgi:hypothetical protein